MSRRFRWVLTIGVRMTHTNMRRMVPASGPDKLG